MTSTRWAAIQVVFLVLLTWVTGSRDSTLCPSAVLCSCLDADLFANCSTRGFSAVPPGLPVALKSLDMSRNQLKRINSTEMFRLSSLEHLDLSRNRLSEFTMSGGQMVHFNLRKLDLSHNRISSVKRLWLTGLERLQDLNLANNQIESLPARTLFEVGYSLRRVNFKGNRIVNLDPHCFNDLHSLKELTLTKNKLSSFPKEVELPDLEVLELNKNSFVQIEGLMFNGLPKLKKLRLKRNQIEFLSDGAFYISGGVIEEISLDRNKIDKVQKGWLYGLDNLRFLSLANNRIDYIATDGWDTLKNLEELDMRSNKLQLLDRESLCSLPELRFLYLQDNRISHIDGEEGGGYCSERTFGDVPLLEELYLDGNEISHTIEDMAAPFKGLKYLRTLSLSRNRIKLIGEHAFSGGLNGLEEIDVRENFGLSTVQDKAFENLPKLKAIHLDSESMLCDCYLKWFPRWLNLTGIIGSGNARCAHPENLKGRAVQGVAYESFTCDDFPKPYIIQQPETQKGLRGENLTLFCRAASTSPANMTFLWQLDSNILEDVRNDVNCSRNTNRCVQSIAHSFDGKGREITSQLHLKNLTYDDAGKYQCLVYNDFGRTYSEKADITVYVYPKFVVTPEDHEITVVAGQSATFECGASGFPAPKVKWQKEMVPGTNCSREALLKECFPAAFERRLIFKSGSFSHDKRTTVNTIEMRNITIADMGRYTCNASNAAGSITYNVTLSVMESPKILEPMEDRTFRENESAVIKCMVSGMPKPQITWFKDGKRLLATERHFLAAEDQVLVVTGATKEDAGRYECTINNQLGNVNMSGLVTIIPGEATITTTKHSNETSEPNDMLNNTIIIVIAIGCVAAGILLVWLITCCCKTQNCCVKPRHHPDGIQYNNPEEAIFHTGPSRGQVRSKEGPTLNGSPSMHESSYLNAEGSDHGKDKLLSSVPHHMNISSKPGLGEFEKRKEMDITKQMWKNQQKRNIEATKSGVTHQPSTEIDIGVDSSLLSMSSVTDDNETKALLTSKVPRNNSNNSYQHGTKTKGHVETCVDMDLRNDIYLESSSSEKDSGTGDSKRSNENVDCDYIRDSFVNDNQSEEDMAEGEYGEIGDGEIKDYHLSGGGESAMNLEEFEATIHKVKCNEDNDFENSPSDSLNIYGPFSDEVDSALGERLSGEPPSSSCELLADSGCGEAIPIYSAPDSIASSSLENPAQDSIFSQISKSKTMNSFLDNSASSVSSSSCCHSRNQRSCKRQHQSSHNLKSDNLINGEEPKSGIKGLEKCNDGDKNDFRTFYPTGRSRNGNKYGSSFSALRTGSMQNGLDIEPMTCKKRGSTFELNGSCYLSLEQSVGDLKSVKMDPILYRGGVGTLPKNTVGFELHQRLLEESLNNSDYAIDRKRQLQQEQLNRKERSSSRTRRSLIFSRNRKNSSSKNNDLSTISGSTPNKNSSYTNSLPRSKSGSSKHRSKSKHKPDGYTSSHEYKSLLNRVSLNDHTAVPIKSNDLFA